MSKIRSGDFETLVAQAMEVPGREAMRPVVEKELLHFDILFALTEGRLLDTLTFQGGTSLRLCHGAPRFSEDLDFAGGRDFKSQNLARIKECVGDYLSRRYRLEVSVKEPEQLRSEPDYVAICVDKWQVSVVTAPARPDIPKQRIKLEITNVPAYTQEPCNIKVHYPFLPDGYNDFLVVAEDIDEIMADKLVSLVNTKSYVRYRDIWDLQWLTQRGAVPNLDLVNKKVVDYGIDGYVDKVRTMIARLPDLVAGERFREQMTRFLPAPTLARTLDNPQFVKFLSREVAATLTTVVDSLEGPDLTTSTPEFIL